MWTTQYHEHLRTPPVDGTGVSYPLCPGGPRVNPSRLYSNTNHNTNHAAPLSGVRARVDHLRPSSAISNPPALPDMGTNHRRAAAPPPACARRTGEA